VLSFRAMSVTVRCRGEKFFLFQITDKVFLSYALAADIQTIPGLPTAPGYLNVDVDPVTGEIDGLF
jgi:formyltetrahydrofolate synthetase